MSEHNGSNNGENNRGDPAENNQNNLDRIDVVQEDAQQVGGGDGPPHNPAQNQGGNAAGNNLPPRRPPSPEEIEEIPRQPLEANVITYNDRAAPNGRPRHRSGSGGGARPFSQTDYEFMAVLGVDFSDEAMRDPRRVKANYDKARAEHWRRATQPVNFPKRPLSEDEVSLHPDLPTATIFVNPNIRDHAKMRTYDQMGRPYRLVPMDERGMLPSYVAPTRARPTRRRSRSRRRAKEGAHRVPGDSSAGEDSADSGAEEVDNDPGYLRRVRPVNEFQPMPRGLPNTFEQPVFETAEEEAMYTIKNMPFNLGGTFLAIWQSMDKNTRPTLLDFANSVSMVTPDSRQDQEDITKALTRQRLEECDTFHISIAAPLNFNNKPVLTGVYAKRKMQALKHYFRPLGKFLKGNGRDGKTSDVCDVLEHLTKAQKVVGLSFAEFMDELIKAFDGPDLAAVKDLCEKYPNEDQITILYKKLVNLLYHKESPTQAKEILGALNHHIPWSNLTEATSEIRRYAKIASYELIAGAKRDLYMDQLAIRALFEVIPHQLHPIIKAEAHRTRMGIREELSFSDYCCLISPYREDIDKFLMKNGGKGIKPFHQKKPAQVNQVSKKDSKPTSPKKVTRQIQQQSGKQQDHQRSPQQQQHKKQQHQPRSDGNHQRDNKNNKKNNADNAGKKRGFGKGKKSTSPVTPPAGIPTGKREDRSSSRGPVTGGNKQPVSAEAADKRAAKFPQPIVTSAKLFEMSGTPLPSPAGLGPKASGKKKDKAERTGDGRRNAPPLVLGSFPCSLCPSTRHTSMECEFFEIQDREPVADICSKCSWGKRHRESACVVVRLQALKGQASPKN